MKTLSFLDLRIGRKRNVELLRLDTSAQGIELSPGFHLIVAPNGYGKTTLFQTLAGITPALGGSALWDGKIMNAARRVLYVSEYLTFPKFIYPAEWIDFMSDGDKREDLGPWIEKFALSSKMGAYLGRMSQGERRKVTWLGAHASSKPILLLDEPLDGLDLLSIAGAREMIQSWKSRERVICVIAHQVGELLDLADEVFLIRSRALVPWSRLKGTQARQLPAEEFRKQTLEFYSGLT